MSLLYKNLSLFFGMIKIIDANITIFLFTYRFFESNNFCTNEKKQSIVIL